MTSHNPDLHPTKTKKEIQADIDSLKAFFNTYNEANASNQAYLKLSMFTGGRPFYSGMVGSLALINSGIKLLDLGSSVGEVEKSMNKHEAKRCFADGIPELVTLLDRFQEEAKLSEADAKVIEEALKSLASLSSALASQYNIPMKTKDDDQKQRSSYLGN